MSFITILNRTIFIASIIAVISNILLINSSATLGGQVSSLETDLGVLTRINTELTSELARLYDIKRIALEAQNLGYKSADTTLTVTLPDPLAMQP